MSRGYAACSHSVQSRSETCYFSRVVLELNWVMRESKWLDLLCSLASAAWRHWAPFQYTHTISEPLIAITAPHIVYIHPISFKEIRKTHINNFELPKDAPSPRPSWYAFIVSQEAPRGFLWGHTCIGTAISVATKAKIPRNALFAATTTEDRPALASTIYARVLE